MNVKRILWCSHISSMVSLRQWSGAELRAWHLQRFPQTRRISLLLWISSETFPHPVRLPPFSALPSPPSTPLPTRGLYILEFCKRKNTPRDTIRNGSVIDTFLFFFFSISKKESLKIRIREGKTKIEIWLNTLCCCWFFFLRKKYPDQKNVSRIRIFKELLFLCVQILFELDEILFFFPTSCLFRLILEFFIFIYFFIYLNRFWIDILEWTITDEISV